MELLLTAAGVVAVLIAVLALVSLTLLFVFFVWALLAGLCVTPVFGTRRETPEPGEWEGW